MPANGMPGGAIIGAAGGERTDFNHLGPAKLSKILSLFFYGPSLSGVRESVAFRTQARMES